MPGSGPRLPAMRPPRIRPSTWLSYQRNVERHIVPALGHLPLQQLTPAQLTRLVDPGITGELRSSSGLVGGVNVSPLQLRTAGFVQQVGDMLEEEVPFVDFGRLAVQAAKQRIIQRVREGERTKIRDEFAGRVGDLLSGEVQQIERGKLVMMLNKYREAEAIIPYREQNHREHYHQGEPVRAVLKRVEDPPKGPRLILSRSDALFVQALFRLEVPEIAQGIVDFPVLIVGILAA